MNTARDSAKKSCRCSLHRLPPLESLNSVRTYVRFVCECDHRDLPGRGGRLTVKARSHTPLRPVNGRLGARAVAFAAVKKSRIDAVLAERGLFPSRSAAAGAVRAGEVRVGQDGPVALRPSQLVEPEAALIVDAGPALRLARRHQARERARGARRSTSPAATASTSAPRPAASPTACCSAAPRGSPRSTSPTARSTCACAKTRG